MMNRLHTRRALSGAASFAPWLMALMALSSLSACAGDCVIERVAGTPPIDRSQVASIAVDLFQSGEFVANDGTRMRYRLLPPATPEPGRKYPLVLQLHSSGGIGEDNQRQLEPMAKAWALPSIRARYPAYVLVPQFPVRSADYDDPVAPQRSMASPAVSVALQLVDRIAADTPAVDRQRIYVTGFSMGGSTTWLAAAQRPELFAAAMPVSGIAPDTASAAALADLPILVLHGDTDTENPIDSDRRMVARIAAEGGKRIHLREYVGLAHSPPGDQLPGFWWRDWLFAQRRDAH